MVPLAAFSGAAAFLGSVPLLHGLARVIVTPLLAQPIGNKMWLAILLPVELGAAAFMFVHVSATLAPRGKLPVATVATLAVIAVTLEVFGFGSMQPHFHGGGPPWWWSPFAAVAAGGGLAIWRAVWRR